MEWTDEMKSAAMRDAARVVDMDAALRKAQKAIALCLSEGGIASNGDDTPWWVAIIEAQQEIARTLRK